MVFRQSLKLTQGSGCRKSQKKCCHRTIKSAPAKEMLDETDGSGVKAKETGDGSLFEVVKPGFSGGQAVLRLFYPAGRSYILPETFEAKAKKLFLAQ
jgi:hypothetical protein